MKEIFLFISSEMIILFFSILLVFRDYQLKLTANTHYERQEHNSLQQM